MGRDNFFTKKKHQKPAIIRTIIDDPEFGSHPANEFLLNSIIKPKEAQVIDGLKASLMPDFEEEAKNERRKDSGGSKESRDSAE